MSDRAIMLLVLPVGAYLIGAIPFGLLVGYLRGVDIRQKGSGNIGATNVGRVLGRKWGLLVFALDVAKGAIPTAIAAWATHRFGPSLGLVPSVQTLLVILVQACCVCGHNWSIYLGFKGGKGVATSLGILVGYWPYLTLPGLVGLATWGVVLLIWRYVSAASIVSAAMFPLYVIAFGVWKGWPISTTALLAGFSATMASLIVIRHRANIKRLLAGTEPKMGQKAAQGGGDPSNRVEAA